MRDGILGAFISVVFLTGCAVSANEFEPAALPYFERAATQIGGRYVVQVTDPSDLSVQATVLGNTCSAVAVSGDFQDRFTQVMDRALTGVFDGQEGAGVTTITIDVAPETPIVRLLRRSYMSGDARVNFAMAADVVISRPDGTREEFHVSPDLTGAQSSQETETCDGAGRALARTFDESATKLATEVRRSLTTAQQR